jgi:Fe-S-cluster containining protein
VNTTITTLSSGIDEIYAKYQTASEAIAKEYSPTCHKGCGACCHFPLISSTAGEAFVLFQILDSLEPAREQIRNHIRTYATRYFEHCRQSGSFPFTESQQKKAFLELNMPCPLFTHSGTDLEGHCAVFAVRPLICSYFHSLDAPNVCAAKGSHRTYHPAILLGEEAIDEIQTLERTLMGRSTLGHLPLFLAAFTEKEGIEAFLNTDFRNAESDALPPEETQWSYDFDLFIELLKAAGYSITETDIHSLLAAKEEQKRRNQPCL